MRVSLSSCEALLLPSEFLEGLLAVFEHRFEISCNRCRWSLIFCCMSRISSTRARNSLRRDKRPVEDCRGPTVSVPSAESTSPTTVTKFKPRPIPPAS